MKGLVIGLGAATLALPMARLLPIGLLEFRNGAGSTSSNSGCRCCRLAAC